MTRPGYTRTREDVEEAARESEKVHRSPFYRKVQKGISCAAKTVDRNWCAVTFYMMDTDDNLLEVHPANIVLTMQDVYGPSGFPSP